MEKGLIENPFGFMTFSLLKYHMGTSSIAERQVKSGFDICTKTSPFSVSGVHITLVEGYCAEIPT